MLALRLSIVVLAFAALPALAQPEHEAQLRCIGGRSHRDNARLIAQCACPFSLLPADIVRLLLGRLEFRDRLSMRAVSRALKARSEQLFGPLFLNSEALMGMQLASRLATADETTVLPWPEPLFRTARLEDLICESSLESCSARLMLGDECLKTFSLRRAYPHQPAAFGSHFYVPCHKAIKIIDVHQMKVLKSIHLGGPAHVPVLVNGLLYVVVEKRNRVVIIDPATTRVVGEISTGDRPWPYDTPWDQSAPAVFENKIYVTNMGLKTLLVIDAKTNTEVRRFNFTDRPRMTLRVRNLIFVQTNSGELYVINALDDTLINCNLHQWGIRIAKLSASELFVQTVMKPQVVDFSAYLGRW